MPMRALPLMIACTLMISSCNFRDEKEAPEDTTTTAPVTADQLNFSEVQAKVFTPSCSCHTPTGGNAAGINLSTYAQVKNQLSKVQKTALENKSMPPPSLGALKSSQAELLKKWIDEGAPEIAQ